MTKYLHEYKKNGKTYYKIRRQIHNKEYYIINTTSKTLALHVLNECDHVQWNIEKIIEIKNHYQKEKPIPENRYITQEQPPRKGYRIQKWTNNRAKYYGKAQTIQHARQIRNHLQQTGWKYPKYQKRKVTPNKYITKINNNTYQIRIPTKKGKQITRNCQTYHEAIQIRKQILQGNIPPAYKNHPHRYIQKTSTGKYAIVRNEDNTTITYDQCNTLQEAIKERDFWESIRWDWDLIDLY